MKLQNAHVIDTSAALGYGEKSAPLRPLQIKGKTMKANQTTNSITLRPAGFDVEKSAEGFTLALRCLSDDRKDVVNIKLACPPHWAPMLDQIADRARTLTHT